MKQNVEQFSGQKYVGEIKNMYSFANCTGNMVRFKRICPKNASVLTRLKIRIHLIR